mmetsp:Transcript_97640/g.193340  ORF Transcript_97640/g.193340 Transcript_97640/m.193340 type:complete len:102 (-) Transcript_97640:3-308(-)
MRLKMVLIPMSASTSIDIFLVELLEAPPTVELRLFDRKDDAPQNVFRRAVRLLESGSIFGESLGVSILLASALARGEDTIPTSAKADPAIARCYHRFPLRC